MLKVADREVALARAALSEITPVSTIGDMIAAVDEGEGVTSVLFASTMPGYRGWNWTASLAQLPGEDAVVLETELMPGDGALLSPDWIPWVDRLADYRAAQEAAGVATDESGQVVGPLDELTDEDDDDDLDDDIDDELDGVDIDSIETEL